MDIAYTIKNDLDVNMPIGFRYNPPIDEVTAARVSLGIASQKELSSIPDTQEIIIPASYTENSLPQIMGLLLEFVIISKKIRDGLDQLEPNVHRFKPVKLSSESLIENTLDHGIWYILLPPLVIDCLDTNKTDFVNGINNDVRELSSKIDSKIVLFNKKLVSCHYWRTKLNKKTSFYTCSVEFKNIISSCFSSIMTDKICDVI